ASSAPSAARTASTELPRSISTTAPAPSPLAAARNARSTSPPSVPSEPSGMPPAARTVTCGPAIWPTRLASPVTISRLCETSTSPTYCSLTTTDGILQCRTPFDNSNDPISRQSCAYPQGRSEEHTSELQSRGQL